MNLTHVQYVLTIAKHGSFSEAAKHLFVSQSALSQQIRNLEMELGYDLFRRTAQGVTLTEAGNDYCRLAQPVLDAWEVFRNTVCLGGSSVRRKMRIGMGSRAYSNGLFEDIVHFFDKHPELEVTFVAEAGQDFISGLKSGALDLALDRLTDPGQRGLAAYDLIREQQCILMSPDDPLRRLPQITFSDLEDCTVMTGLEHSVEDKALRELCRMHGISFKRIYRSDSIETIMQLVRSRKGIVYGPRSFADYYGVAAVPLVPETDDCLRFICLQKHASRPDILLFRRYMMELCRGRDVYPAEKYL